MVLWHDFGKYVVRFALSQCSVGSLTGMVTKKETARLFHYGGHGMFGVVAMNKSLGRLNTTLEKQSVLFGDVLSRLARLRTSTISSPQNPDFS